MPVTSKELMHLCVIDKAIIIFIVVAVVPASIALTFLGNTRTKEHEKGVLVWASGHSCLMHARPCAMLNKHKYACWYIC